jgi:hypothetical protein
MEPFRGTGTPTEGRSPRSLTPWPRKEAAAAPSATMATYLHKSAEELKGGTCTGYGKAEGELSYLVSLPATDVSSAQTAQAQADVQALDGFFGTPGLLS